MQKFIPLTFNISPGDIIYSSTRLELSVHFNVQKFRHCRVLLGTFLNHNHLGTQYVPVPCVQRGHAFPVLLYLGFWRSYRLDFALKITAISMFLALMMLTFDVNFCTKWKKDFCHCTRTQKVYFRYFSWYGHAGGLNRVFLMKLNRFVGSLNKLKRYILKKQCLQVIKNKWVFLLELELENLDMPENINFQCFYHTKNIQLNFIAMLQFKSLKSWYYKKLAYLQIIHCYHTYLV